MNEKWVQTRVRFFFIFSYSSTTNYCICKLRDKMFEPSALLLDILLNSGTSLGEILGKTEIYFSQFTFHKSANLKNNTNIQTYLRGPWMYYVCWLWQVLNTVSLNEQNIPCDLTLCRVCQMVNFQSKCKKTLEKWPKQTDILFR